MLSEDVFLEALQVIASDVSGADYKHADSAAGPDSMELIRIQSSDDYDKFFKHCMLANVPCIISTGTVDHWKANLLWVKNGHINYEYLEKKYGDDEVPVADCSREEYDSHPKKILKFRDYLRYLQDEKALENECLYLKDYHFMRLHPADEIFHLHPFFSSDWLNEFCDAKQSDDYRFVYIGPSGSWTPFHADVLRSYSWSANISGRKKWHLYPPGTEDELKDKLGNLPFDVTKLPQSKRHRELTVVQEAGEIIFVPSGWHHQVHNLEETLSINHNWLNGCSIRHSWSYLCSSLTQVQQEISDCRKMDNWTEHCQVLLRAYLGFNFADMIELLTVITKQRLDKLVRNCHDKFDLVGIGDLLKTMSEDREFTPTENFSILKSQVEEWSREIEEINGIYYKDHKP